MSHRSDAPRYSADWDSAICSQLGGAAADELFFPTGPDQHAVAASLCQTCPMREPCIEQALIEERDEPLDGRFGIRGGLTATQRIRLQRDRDYHELRKAS